MEQIDPTQPLEWVSDGTPVTAKYTVMGDFQYLYFKDRDQVTPNRPFGYYNLTGGYVGAESSYDRIRNSATNPKDFEYDI